MSIRVARGRELSIGFVGAMMCVLALSACSSGESNATRAAAEAAPSVSSADPETTGIEVDTEDVLKTQVGSDRWPMEVVCDGNRYSFTAEGNFTNLTNIPLILLAGDIDCADWSGTATPATSLTGKTVQPGEAFNYSVEARNNYQRRWTMGVMTEDYAEFPQTFRMEILVGSMGMPKLTYSGGRYWFDCYRVRLGADPSGKPSTRLPDPPGGDTYTNQLWFWSDGESIYIMHCYDPPKPNG